MQDKTQENERDVRATDNLSFVVTRYKPERPFRQITLSNPCYDVTIAYDGNYEQDRRNGTLELKRFFVSVNAKNGFGVPIAVLKENDENTITIFVDYPMIRIITRKDVENLMENVLKAEKSAEKLAKILPAYVQVTGMTVKVRK